MKKTTQREFAVDNASILFLSLIRSYHNNNFRFSVTLKEPVCPDALQQAVNRIHPRFPSVIAGFRQDLRYYRQVAAAKPPIVRPDPGLLHPMTAEELETCAFRVLYKDCTVSIEAYHALTDGCGAITTITTLVAEYLNIRYGIQIPVSPIRLDVDQLPQEHEVSDDYLPLRTAKPRHLPSRFSYLPKRTEDADWQVRNHILQLDTHKLLAAARRYGITVNTLLTTVLAESVMEMQLAERGGKSLKPVRVMVPVNMRKIANSRTLRNCSLYTLPTMEHYHKDLSREELCKVFDSQMKQQLSPENLSSMASYNVRTQNAWFFRMLPWKLKAAALRLGYRFFGESNSSMTLTNLGRVVLPEQMMPYVADFGCFMTPRVTSPYGCTVLSFGDKLTLNMCRFCPEDQLGTIFFRKINEITSE